MNDDIVSEGVSDESADAPSYAAALDEIQEILSSLESDTTDVDALAERVRRADALIRHCRSRLDDARYRVEQVVATFDKEPAASGLEDGD